jgi:hypothetical protein
VYGSWSCCENRWQSEDPYTRKSLKMYAKETPEELRESLSQYCKNKKCNKRWLPSSFLLYEQSSSPEEPDVSEIWFALSPRCKKFLINLFWQTEPAVEIKCNLEWNNHYRVFGDWECQHCKNAWKSAYIWISLQKYIKKTPGEELNKNDFYMQKCKECKNEESIILNYQPLDNQESSEENRPHRSNLCAKCKSGNLCNKDSLASFFC